MATSFATLYRTRRDGGITYCYAVSWRQNGTACEWVSRVCRDGQPVGSPVGEFQHPGGRDGDLRPLVRRVVEKRIEERMGVDE
jgi:hypothetical protein